MKAGLLFLMLAGCAAAVPVEQVEPSVPEQIRQVPEEPKEREVKPKRAAKPPEKKEIPAAPKVLPPCESAPGDKKTAILQKLECVAETADKKPAAPKLP